jgi:hypothetical protein
MLSASAGEFSDANGAEPHHIALLSKQSGLLRGRKAAGYIATC